MNIAILGGGCFWCQEGQTRLQGPGVFAEALDRELTALRHQLDGVEKDDQRQHNQRAAEQTESHEVIP